jgi:CubicO group peptidase (beta-lactamase class C family)
MRARLALILLTASACPAVSSAQISDTPAGHELAAWLAVFNSANRDSLRAFYQQHYPSAPARIDQMLDFRERTGGFELVKVTTSTATHVAAYLQERASDQFAEVTIDIDSVPPHHISGLRIGAIERPAEFALRRLGPQELPQAVRTQAEHDAATERFSGAVLIAQNGKPIVQAAYGDADRERKIQNTLDTRFRLGSMNKMFTATAIMQLVEAGTVKLDAPLATYLPDYPNKELASKVTIHHLLTHTGGTGDIFTPEYETRRLELRSLADYVKLFGNRAVQFEPGARFAYSNYGFILLGRVVEAVSGTSYYDYVAKHVYAPAGMTSSGSEPEDSLVKGRAVGYTKEDSPNGAWQPNTNTLPWRGTSAGGGYSTVGDLLRFAEALRGHKLLDARHTDLLTSVKVEAPGGGKYAYGFGVTTSNGLHCFGHNGGAPGMNGDLAICDGGYVIAVLANMDPPAAGRISTFIKNRLPATGESKPNATQ